MILGVDGGNSKTLAVLVDDEGGLLAAARTAGCSPHALGLAGAVERLGGLVDDLLAQACLGRTTGGEPTVTRATYFLAGVDEEHEEHEATAALAATGWARETVASNDSYAVLHAGAARGWGVALVCGAGVNALGVAPDGRRARYQALGPLSGDWGGGEALGEAALGAAIRATDLRGPLTSLATAVPAELGFATPQAAADAIFHRRIPASVLLQLPPLVFAEARSGDAVAAALVDRQASELAAMATGLVRRLGIAQLDVEVICGGGLLESGEPLLLDGIVRRVREVASSATFVQLVAPPVLGAVLDGMRALGLPEPALDRARREVATLVGVRAG